MDRRKDDALCCNESEQPYVWYSTRCYALGYKDQGDNVSHAPA